MTLGRTSSGAIKIKTDEAGGGLRAVECACCSSCNCNPPLTVKYKVTGISFGSIAIEQFWSACGILIANASTGHYITAERKCTNGTIPYWFDGWEIYVRGGPTFVCSNLAAFVFSSSPVGTHELYGGNCWDPEVDCPCGDHLNGGNNSPRWTLTIEEDTE